MINDVQMLNYIRKNTQMGIDGIQVVLEHTQDNKLSQVLNSQLEEYRSIYNSADEMLKNRGGQEENVNAAIKISSHLMGKFKAMKDNSSSSIAESMIKGSASGVTKIIKHQNEYSGEDSDIKALSEKLLYTEQSNIEQLKMFL